MHTENTNDCYYYVVKFLNGGKKYFRLSGKPTNQTLNAVYNYAKKYDRPLSVNLCGKVEALRADFEIIKSDFSD